MQSDNQFVPISKPVVWTGHILSALSVLFLLMDGVMKLLKPAPVVEAMTELGYPLDLTVSLGIVLIACVILHLIPQTSVLGAILITGYLGGAVATHVRVHARAFPVLFPVIIGVLIWGGLYLRNARVRALIPLR